MHFSKKTVAIYMVVIFGLGFIAGLFPGKPSEQANLLGAAYPLLAKRLFVDNPNDTRINFSPLRSSLNTYFTDNKLDGSLYFEYLPTGTSVRVNPDARYRAASLIKLPVSMEVYKAHELGKLDINRKVALKEEWLNDSFGTLYEKGPGYELTLKEAVEIMLKESDNTALRILIDVTQNLDINDRALGSLDIELTTHEDGSIDIGTRPYGSFLKCLYFACYNTKEDSQAILRLISETPFDNRLVAGVNNKDITIAHKIGVFNTQVQSDCGIVYLPDNNYVLCIMLAGNDSEQVNARFADISRIVYSFVKQ